MGQFPVKVEIFGSPEFEKRLEKDRTHIFSQSPKISLEIASILIIMTSQYFTMRIFEPYSSNCMIFGSLESREQPSQHFSRFGNVRQIFTEKLKKAVAFSLTVFFSGQNFKMH